MHLHSCLATKEQYFDDIDTGALEHLYSTPTSATLPADAVARPGETLIGRVIGNLNTGQIGPNGELASPTHYYIQKYSSIYLQHIF